MLGSLSWLALYSNRLTGASRKPAGCLHLLTSLTALGSASKRPGRKCYLMVCRAAATLMVCAGELELAFSVCQPSDRCVCQAHTLVQSPMSLTALSSLCKQPNCGRCPTVCRAAATLIVCGGRLEPPWPGLQQLCGPSASPMMKPGTCPLAGALPMEWQDMGALRALDLAGNALTGTLPEG